MSIDKIRMEVVIYINFQFRRVAQGLEHYLDTVGVGGSRPPVPTSINKGLLGLQICRYAQLSHNCHTFYPKPILPALHAPAIDVNILRSF